MSRPFQESDRFDYPELLPEDIVIDIGVFEGNWANMMHHKFGCRVIGFEPVPEFFYPAHKRFAETPAVKIFPYAVGDRCGPVTLGVKGSMSGVDCRSYNHQAEARMISIEEAFGFARLYTPAVVKINAEGAEFMILETALDRGLVPRVRHWQVQPHGVVENAEARWTSICRRMEETHELVYASPWIFYGWRLR